ncbi:MAG TPA: hypothetical protein VGI58_13610 [Streptosporangiaceae bacterium]
MAAAQSQDDIAWWEAYQLAETDQPEALRARAVAGDDHARWQLAHWLADRGRPGEAADLVRPLADLRDDLAGTWLARWLADDGDLAELRRRAAAGDYHCLQELAGALAGTDQIPELRAVLSTPDGQVRPELAAWLARSHGPDVWRLGAELGDADCGRRLERWVRMLAERQAAAGGGPA